MQMLTKEIEKYIVKYLTGTIANQEKEVLNQWLKEKVHHQELFKEYVRVHYAINLKTTKTNVENFKEQQLNNIQKQKRKPFKYYYLQAMKYTAILVLVFTFGYVAYQKLNSKTNTVELYNKEITLQVNNGDLNVINQGAQKNIVNKEGEIIAVQQNNKLVVVKNNTSKTVWSKLTVPYGKQFEIELADGTNIYLNSGTTIEYPSNFNNSNYRNINMVGEAYFSVESNKQKPFIVNTNKLNIRVLGTQFNVSAYPEEANISTVLVEGKVGLYDQKTFNKTSATILKPGFKGSYHQQNKTFEVKKVDTRIYTSWKNGILIFRNIPFKNILKRLERNYNVTISNHNKILETEYFNASFDMDEQIEDILKTFQKSFDFKFQIKNNQITIH